MGFLLAVSLRSLALALAAAVLLAIFRVKSPATRHAIWTVVAAGMLALAIASATLPVIPIRVLSAVPAPRAIPIVAFAPLNVPAATPAPLEQPFPWTRIYLAILLILTARLAYAYFLTRRLTRNATRIDAFDDAIFESAQIAVPLTIAGRILLPTEWRTWEAAKLDAVLTHERAHVHRCDWAIAAFAAANRCIFWFHPLAWWLEARIKSLAEQACDDASLAHLDRESYAEVLVEIAAALRGAKHRVAWQAMPMAKGAEVRMRIERILDETRPLSTPLTRTLWAAIALAAAPIIYIAAVARPAHVQAQQQTPPPMTAPPATTDNTELERATAVLHQLESEAAKFKRDHLDRMPEQFQTNVSQMNNLQMSLDQANEALARMQQEKLLLETQLANAQAQLSYYRSTAGDDLNQRIEDMRAQIATMQEMYTDAAPQLKSAKARLSALEKERDAGRPASPKTLDLEGSMNMLHTQIQGIKMNMEQKLQQIQALNKTIAQYQTRIESTPQLEQQYAEVLRKYAEAQRTVQFLSTRSTTGPRVISRREAEYTDEARKAKLEGKVELWVTVGADGRTREIEVIRGLGAGLDEKAVDAVKQWRFQPATHQGNPVDAVIVVEVPFRLL
jgi:TonB family protein